MPYQLFVVVGDGPCFPDRNEPNDGPAQATEPWEARFWDEGLRICPGDEDWWAVELDQNDGFELEVCVQTGGGNVEVSIFDPGRVERGELQDPGFVTAEGELRGGETCYELWLQENGDVHRGGDWMVRVRGAGPEAVARYRIQARRALLECLLPEEGELDRGGNDEQGGALRLDDIEALVDEDGLLTPDVEHVVPGQRLLCPTDDVDWFCFRTQDSDSLEAWLTCDEARGELHVRITDDVGNVVGGAGRCVRGESRHAGAVAGADGSYCIQVAGDGAAHGPYTLHVLREPVADREGPVRVSATRFDTEHVFIDRRTSLAGAHLARVYRGGDGVESAYAVVASVIPDLPGAPCPADSYEPNEEVPAQLGDGEKTLCDLWVCDAEDPDSPPDADLFEISVPANQDRTFLIQFASRDEGQLFLYTEVPPLDPHDFAEIRASGVEANLIAADGPGTERVNYTLWVVDTDLDANPSGACELLGAPPNGACTDDDRHDFNGTGCWQTAILPD